MPMLYVRRGVYEWPVSVHLSKCYVLGACIGHRSCLLDFNVNNTRCLHSYFSFSKWGTKSTATVESISCITERLINFLRQNSSPKFFIYLLTNPMRSGTRNKDIRGKSSPFLCLRDPFTHTSSPSQCSLSRSMIRLCHVIIVCVHGITFMILSSFKLIFEEW